MSQARVPSSRRYSRQSALVTCDMSTPILVVGAGGIGSFTVLTLAKMGFENITVFDMDTVEEHNLPNQFYRQSDIGAKKVDVLNDIVFDFTGIAITPWSIEFTKDFNEFIDIRPAVIISAVDSMSARKLIYEVFQESGRADLFVDGRMGADQSEVYVVRKGDRTTEDFYASRLWPDAETAPVPCTSKATMYNVLSIASMIANNVRLNLVGEHPADAVVLDNRNLRMYYPKLEE